jgi:hypothetical protein
MEKFSLTLVKGDEMRILKGSSTFSSRGIKAGDVLVIGKCDDHKEGNFKIRILNVWKLTFFLINLKKIFFFISRYYDNSFIFFHDHRHYSTIPDSNNCCK